LYFDLKLGQRQIARSANVSQSTVHDYLERFTAARLHWPLPTEMTEAEVEGALFPADPGKGREPTAERSLPDFAPGFRDLTINYNDPGNVFNCHNAAGGGCPVFKQPLPNTIGNVGRNRFEGPRLTNVDFSVMKNFPFMEKHHFQFRAEFFNFFNKTNFKLPSSTAQFSGGAVTSSLIGSAGSAEDARVIQLGLRLDW
jgi:hypothetical protein